MQFSSLFTKKSFIWVACEAFAVSLLFAIINIFVIGGDQFVITLSDVLPIPLAILTAFFALNLWRKFDYQSSGRTLWGLLFLGWVMWALGELLYFIFSLSIKEVPYPSMADFFYIVGYLPFVIGLISYIRETPRRFSRIKVYLIVFTYIVIIASVFTFVILPLIQNGDPASPLTTLLDAAYPIGDLLLLLLVVWLLFDYYVRSSSVGWVLLIIGFVLMTFADMMYSYTTSFGLYNPEGKANLITALGSSVPYCLAYVFWMLGIYRLQIKQEVILPLSEVAQPAQLENAHLALFLRKDMTVDEVSVNLARVFAGVQPVGSDLASVIGISAGDKQLLQSKLVQSGKFADLDVRLRTRKNELVLAKMNGMSLFDPHQNFNGAIIVLRLFSAANDLDVQLTDYQRSIINDVKIKTGSTEDQDVCDFLRAYFLPQLRQIEALVYQNGGSQQGVVFLEFLNQWAEKKGWHLRLTPKTLEVGAEYTPTQLLKDLNELLGFARGHLERMADPGQVDIELQKVKDNFTDPVNTGYRYIKLAYRN